MDSQFWIDRWARKEIGFHQRDINGYLRRYWPSLTVPPAATVFVPLCGKTLDMHWLHERGHPVIGVEVAREAVADFFEEWGVDAQVTQSGRFERWHAGKITILCGDFFDLTAADLSDVRAVFDRAALIALPPALREAYARKLCEVLPPGTEILLVTADYPQQQMSGPPFAVSDAEVRRLFAESNIQQLDDVDVTDLPDNARFRQRGLTRLVERIYRLD